MNRKPKYTKEQFKIDRLRLIEMVGRKLSYSGCDPSTFRVTFGDDELHLYFDVYLSRHTVVVRLDKHKPLYFRRQTWQQIEEMLSNVWQFL